MSCSYNIHFLTIGSYIHVSVDVYNQPMNIGVAKVFQIGKTEKIIDGGSCTAKAQYFFISSKEGWCGESHTLPYPATPLFTRLKRQPLLHFNTIIDKLELTIQ